MRDLFLSGGQATIMPALIQDRGEHELQTHVRSHEQGPLPGTVRLLRKVTKRNRKQDMSPRCSTVTTGARSSK
jgi:hypothetical protein